MPTLVIIPAYNEGKNIGSVIQEVKKYAENILVVDDGSTDLTKEIAQKKNVEVISHSVNLGKGAALKTGCDYAYKQGVENIVVIDADGQHEPKDIPRFLEALKGVDIVFGYRKQSNTMPLILKFGNRFINETLRLLFQIKVYDSQCGYRAFKSSIYPKIRWKANDYYMETEMIVKAGRNNLKHKQISIETIYGDKYKGTTAVDGVKIVGKMIGWRLLK
ncbi:MAG: glycosyltransferase family 2 protein [Candidatus Margulisbacteria bacterium]|nr:glycosyltransferase family 2 protein [Candidatus Margulisiibacteriota bacterium]MBU1622067.1 glycosyltransferase family 2 protein [Nanoarchaeota archaeon]